MKISVLISSGDPEEIDWAVIGASVGERAIIYRVESSAWDENGQGRHRRLSLERNLNGRGSEKIEITKRDDYFKAFEDLVALGMRNGVIKNLLCGSCPAEKNGLPGPVV